MTQMSDEAICELLRELDDSDRSVSEWVGRFIESVVYRYQGPLSESQRDQGNGNPAAVQSRVNR